MLPTRMPPSPRPASGAMRAKAMQGGRELRLAAGTDDCVTQPMRMDALVGALENAVP
jgi:hypothetical protein